MKVLIIGAYGFLGNHILNKLLKEDLYDIHILIKPESKSRFGNHENLCKKHFYGSDNFLKILSEENFEVVINCSVYYGKNEDQNQVYETNFLFPTKIIAQLQNSLKLFINFDSYFNKPEFNSYNYLENYIKSKSQFVSSIDSKIKYTFLNLRLEHLYGLFDSDHKFFKKMYIDLKNNKPEIDLTLGNQKRDFIYIDDVVNLILLILKKPSLEKGKIIHNVGTGRSISIKECLLFMKNELKSKSQLNFGAIALRKNEVMDSKSSYENLEIQYGWKPIFNLEDGIINMIENEK